jgi:hypothetical protein
MSEGTGIERSYIPTPKENVGLFKRYGYSLKLSLPAM